MNKQLSCGCSDRLCPACHGDCEAVATQMLKRTDMSDVYDIPMCDDCAADAMTVGVFDSKQIRGFTGRGQDHRGNVAHCL